MSPYRRNVAVGLTVLVAMLILGWMILQFGGRLATPFTEAQFPVRFISDRADGLSNGSPVQYRGVTVGRVVAVQRDPASMITVFIDAMIDAAPPLPDNVEGRIRTQGLIGSGSAIVLETVPPGSPPTGTLRSGKQLRAHFIGLDFVPAEFSLLATDLRETVRQFNESKVIANFNQQVAKFGELMDSANTLISDPKLRDDLQKSLANLRDLSESARRLAGNLEKTSGNLDQLTADTRDAVIRASKVLERFESIASKLDTARGTGGLLLNDPGLYQSLLAGSEQLTLAIRDLRRLLEQWEQEGVSLKLK